MKAALSILYCPAFAECWPFRLPIRISQQSVHVSNGSEAIRKEGAIMKRLKRHVCLIGVLGIVVALGALWATPVKAESDVANPSLKEMLEKRSKETVAVERPTAAVPEDPFGRGTPRSSVRGFLSSAKDRDYVRAAEYLDLRNLPPGMTE
jgi:hypothetical protein